MSMLLANITPWVSEFHIFFAMTVKKTFAFLRLNLLKPVLSYDHNPLDELQIDTIITID